MTHAWPGMSATSSWDHSPAEQNTVSVQTFCKHPCTPSPHPLCRNPSHGADTAVGVHPGIVDTYLAGHFFKTQGVAWTGGRGTWAGSVVSAGVQRRHQSLQAAPLPHTRGGRLDRALRSAGACGQSRGAVRRTACLHHCSSPGTCEQKRSLSGRVLSASPATAEYRGTLLYQPIPLTCHHDGSIPVPVWGGNNTRATDDGGYLPFSPCRPRMTKPWPYSSGTTRWNSLERR